MSEVRRFGKVGQFDRAVAAVRGRRREAGTRAAQRFAPARIHVREDHRRAARESRAFGEDRAVERDERRTGEGALRRRFAFARAGERVDAGEAFAARGEARAARFGRSDEFRFGREPEHRVGADGRKRVGRRNRRKRVRADFDGETERGIPLAGAEHQIAAGRDVHPVEPERAGPELPGGTEPAQFVRRQDRLEGETAHAAVRDHGRGVEQAAAGADRYADDERRAPALRGADERAKGVVRGVEQGAGVEEVAARRARESKFGEERDRGAGVGGLRVEFADARGVEGGVPDAQFGNAAGDAEEAVHGRMVEWSDGPMVEWSEGPGIIPGSGPVRGRFRQGP